MGKQPPLLKILPRLNEISLWQLPRKPPRKLKRLLKRPGKKPWKLLRRLKKPPLLPLRPNEKLLKKPPKKLKKPLRTRKRPTNTRSTTAITVSKVAQPGLMTDMLVAGLWPKEPPLKVTMVLSVSLNQKTNPATLPVTF